MPDWSYRTLFRPLLRRMPPLKARNLTLRAMGTVSRLPGGTLLIRTLGHMEPSPMLKSHIGDVPLTTPVGLSGEVDPGGLAQRALAQLGFGFVEIGPVTAADVGSTAPKRVAMDPVRETIAYPDGHETLTVDQSVRAIRDARHRKPIFARLAPSATDVTPQQAAEQLKLLIREMANAGAAGFTIDVMSRRRAWTSESYLAILNSLEDAAIEAASASPGSAAKSLLWRLPADCPEPLALELAAALSAGPWTGIAVGCGSDDASASALAIVAGPQHRERTLRLMRLLRGHTRPGFLLQAAAGIHEPADALDAMSAGADQVLLGSGFVYGGPGLPKRIADALVYEEIKNTPEPRPPSFWRHWGWMCLLGIGMIVGGAAAWLIAISNVVLPYDESFLGMTREELRRVHPHLLHFMSHDRITLAGTMFSIGILYYMLAKHGMRNGLHWARTAVLVSCLIGFPSFFLYLGYGFFDPLHATAAAILLPMFLLSMRRNPDRPSRAPANLRSDRIWRKAVWGQLCFVALGISLAVGGLTIASVGVSFVFVPSDLAYLNVTPAQLDAINPRLIPIIAHDRAGFGGALLADAAALLAAALWGIQQGARWLWRTLLLSGAPAFFAALSVHFEIGYQDFIHLLPSYFALFLYIVGLILLYPYMNREPEAYSSPKPAPYPPYPPEAASSSS